MNSMRPLSIVLLLVAGRANATAALVAGIDELYALQDGTVVTLDREARVVRRCAALEPRPDPPAPRGPLAIDAEDLLRFAGLPDDDTGSTDAEDLLRDEGFRPGQRRSAAGAIVEVRALAADAGANRAWIATSAGLYRTDRDGCLVAALAGRDLRAVAAGDGIVAAVDERLLWRVGADGAVRTHVVGLLAPTRALAVEPGGSVLIADDDGVVDVSPSGETTRVLDRASDALAVCDGRAVALARDGTYAWVAGNRPLRTGPRVPARTIACGRAPDVRYIATGSGVWTSADGVSWTERELWSGRRVAAAAAGRDQVWLLVDDRIVPLEPPRVRAHAAFRDAFDAVPATDIAPLDTRRWVAPRFPWPELALLFAAQETPTRFGWAIEIVLAFPLGRRGIHRSDRRGVAVELVRRDRELAGAEAELSVSAQEDDENLAMRRVVAAERQALR
jgi:hypothetical protein